MNKLWKLTIIFAVLLVVDLLIPDPLPVLDELVLLFGTLVSGYFAVNKKSFKGKKR